jgi:DNA primase
LPIPEETINQIKERADITRVIGEYVPLKRVGKNYKGLCPFHTEKTPSFIVSPDKGIYHCFGCGAGGNVFSFIMQFKGLTFPEAVRYLGDRVGIRVGSVGTQNHREARASALREIMSVSAQYYQMNLSAPFGADALKYLQERKLSTDTIKTFNLGYARDSWDALLEHLKARGYEAGLIEEAGLAVRRKSGTGYYDRFRNRIMFPILDRIGRYVGFGGRILGSNKESIPKYINTSENPIFHKGSTLYGLSQAEESLKKLDHAFVVEGYIDVIRMHDQGLRNTVAPLGTALTEEHISLILRYTRNMYLIFDPDEAGVKAALRSTTIMHRRGVDPFVIRLPGGYDPGNFFDTYELKEFLLMKEEALTGIDFIIRRFTEKKKVYTAHEKISILESLSEYYENMRDDIFREDFIHRLSKALGTDSTVLKREIIRREGHTREVESSRLKKRISPEHEMGSPAAVSKSIQTELYLLLLILSNPQYLELAAPRLDEGYFHGKWTKKLWKSIIRAAARGDWDSSTVFNSIGDDQFVKYLSGKLVEEIFANNPKEQLIDTIATLKEIRLKEKLARVAKELRKAELDNDEARETDLLVEKNALSNELKKIEQLRASKIRL